MKKLLIVSTAAFLLVLIAMLMVTGFFGAFNTNPPNPSPTPTATPSPTTIPTPTPPPTIIVPDDFSTISSAIANAPSGYRILVKNGTYYERPLNITKSLTIVSQYQNGAHLVFHPQQKVYEAESQRNYLGYQFDIALEINADNVSLSGFLISVEMPTVIIHPDYFEDKKGLILVKADGAQILNNNLLDGENVNFVIYGNANKVVGNSLGSISINGNNSGIESNQISEQASIAGELNLLNKNNVAAILLGGNNNTISSNQVIGGNVGINLKSNYVYRQINYNLE